MGIAAPASLYARGPPGELKGRCGTKVVVYRRTPHVRLCLTSMYAPHNHRTAILAPACSGCGCCSFRPAAGCDPTLLLLRRAQLTKEESTIEKSTEAVTH